MHKFSKLIFVFSSYMYKEYKHDKKGVEKEAKPKIFMF